MNIKDFVDYLAESGVEISITIKASSEEEASQLTTELDHPEDDTGEPEPTEESVRRVVTTESESPSENEASPEPDSDPEQADDEFDEMFGEDEESVEEEPDDEEEPSDEERDEAEEDFRNLFGLDD